MYGNYAGDIMNFDMAAEICEMDGIPVKTILVTDDILGLSEFSPRFVKRYSNLKKIIDGSVKNYSKDVRTRRFPSYKNVYKLKK